MVRMSFHSDFPLYYKGVDQAVAYLPDGAVVWNGLTSVTHSTTESVDVEHYFDGKRTHISQERGELESLVQAYTYPEELTPFLEANLGVTPQPFGICYRTGHGTGHQIHILYNVVARSPTRNWQTWSSTVAPMMFNWTLSGVPLHITGAQPSLHFTLDLPEDAYILDQVEAILYGDEENDPRLPSPDELVELYSAMLMLKITYHSNGTYTAEGPDDVVRILPDGQFELNTPTALVLEAGRFVVSSY